MRQNWRAPVGTTSPFEFWKLFFSAVIMGEFVKNTDTCGLKTQAVWVNVTVDTLFNFFSIIFFMGIVRLPEMRSFWSRNPKYRREWVKSIIVSRDRFHQIWSCFHYVNVTPFTEADIKVKNSIDGFWRVADFVESLAETSSHLCRRAFDIDEMCIFFNGRHSCRCYNGSKVEKWHFKAFSLNDPTTGYYL